MSLLTPVRWRPQSHQWLRQKKLRLSQRNPQHLLQSRLRKSINHQTLPLSIRLSVSHIDRSSRLDGLTQDHRGGIPASHRNRCHFSEAPTWVRGRQWWDHNDRCGHLVQMVHILVHLLITTTTSCNLDRLSDPRRCQGRDSSTPTKDHRWVIRRCKERTCSLHFSTWVEVVRPQDYHARFT